MASQHKMSRSQENRTAATFGGRRTPMSGAGWAQKNDVKTPSLLIENKTTGNKSSITLKSKDLVELWHNAVREDRLPVLQFDLNGRLYVVLTQDDFLGFLQQSDSTE